jgi:GT2 family glycosyltransferase
MITSIIIPCYNKLYYTKLCTESIRKYTTKGSYEIIVVDNGSTDGTVRWLKNQRYIKGIYNKTNLGFTKACNQGILAASGDNILLLNNDVVVTQNWLDNLIKCLYSSNNIGAVGPVTNYCTNLQVVPVNHKNLIEMHAYARKFNISNSTKWEERLRLIGFCFLVKKEVVNKIGLLDEIFSPGGYEDDDYSLRIRSCGYRLFLCKDTFIHHFGSISFKENMVKFQNLDHINRNKFKNKWNIDAEVFKTLRKDITSLIKKYGSKNSIILHIGCGAGGTLLDIKNELPESNLYGIEENSKAVINTAHFAQIDIGTENTIKKYAEKYFHCIIITLNTQNVNIYINLFNNVKRYVKDNGCIIVTIPMKFRPHIEFIKGQLRKRLTDVLYSLRTDIGKDDMLLHLSISSKK